MNKETIIVANLKCSGCANTISRSLNALPGMKAVEVNHDNGEVTVTYETNLERKVITDKLHQLGYPEATEENGLLTKMKSYAACIIGRINE